MYERNPLLKEFGARPGERHRIVIHGPVEIHTHTRTYMPALVFTAIALAARGAPHRPQLCSTLRRAAQPTMLHATDLSLLDVSAVAAHAQVLINAQVASLANSLHRLQTSGIYSHAASSPFCSMLGVCPPPPPLCSAFGIGCPDLASALSSAYHGALEQHYYSTTAAQAFALVGAGDALSQAIERRGGGGGEYDPARTVRMALLGLLIGGLGTACWLRHLEAALPGHDSAARVLQKAALDACVWAPLANSGYLVLTPLLEGRRPEEVASMVRARFVPVMRTELCTFFPYNLVSFSAVRRRSRDAAESSVPPPPSRRCCSLLTPRVASRCRRCCAPSPPASSRCASPSTSRGSRTGERP